VSKHHYAQKLCRSRFLSIEPLKPKRTGIGWRGYDERASVANNLQNLFGGLPDLVIAYKPLDHAGFGELPCSTAIQYNEVKEARFKPEVRQSRPTFVIFHHLNEYLQQKERIREWCGVHAFHIPHVADPAIFRDYKNPKMWDCTLVGSMSGRVYPLRAVFREALAILRTRGLRCLFYEHPGNVLEKASSNWHLVQMAQIVNQSRITCFCSSIYRYRLQKYVEVPASASAIAADVPATADNLKEILIECNVPDGPQVIADRLQKALDSGEADQRAAAGVEFAARFTPATYCKALLSIMKGF
jgi:hypothetical protein